MNPTKTIQNRRIYLVDEFYHFYMLLLLCEKLLLNLRRLKVVFRHVGEDGGARGGARLVTITSLLPRHQATGRCLPCAGGQRPGAGRAEDDEAASACRAEVGTSPPGPVILRPDSLPPSWTLGAAGAQKTIMCDKEMKLTQNIFVQLKCVFSPGKNIYGCQVSIFQPSTRLIRWYFRNFLRWDKLQSLRERHGHLAWRLPAPSTCAAPGD